MQKWKRGLRLFYILLMCSAGPACPASAELCELALPLYLPTNTSASASTYRRNQEYYRTYLRENFVTWRDEDDLERIKSLVAKAEADSDYVLSKVCL